MLLNTLLLIQAYNTTTKVARILTREEEKTSDKW